jgi:hypothetical protein
MNATQKNQTNKKTVPCKFFFCISTNTIKSRIEDVQNNYHAITHESVIGIDSKDQPIHVQNSTQALEYAKDMGWCPVNIS